MQEGDGAPGWQQTFWVLWIGQLVAMIGFAAVLPFMPLYVQELGVVDPASAALWAGAAASIAALTQAVMAPIWGALADRHGRKPMVTRSIISGGIVVGIMSVVGDAAQLVGLRAAQGVFSGTVSASRTLVASVVPSGKLGQSLGLMATGAFVGSSAGPLLGGFLADRVGFRATFLAVGALLLFSGLLVAFFVRERFERPRSARAGGWRAKLSIFVELPAVRAVVVSIFVVQTGQTALSPVLPLFVQELVGPTESAASIAGGILAAAAVTSAAAATLGGRLGDRVGHRRVLAVAAIAAGLLYLPQAFVWNPWQLFGLRALVGLFVGALMPVQMAIVGLLTPPERRGWVFGLTTTSMALGNAAGPLLGSSAASFFGLRASFVVTALALTGAGIWIAMSVRAVGGAPTPSEAAAT